MEFRDYYASLGVPRTASQAEIKKAYRKLARQHHPDVKPGDKAAEQRFKDVNEAHTVLSDPDKRRKYDQFGQQWEAYAQAGAEAGAAGGRGQGDPFGPGGSFSGMFGGARPGGGNVRYEFRSSGDPAFSDFFQVFFADDAAGGAAGQAGGPGRTRVQAGGGGATFEEILAGMGLSGSGTGSGTGSASGRRPGSTGAATATRRRPAPPARVEATAELTLDEAFHGTTRRIDIDGKRLEVKIPPGVDSGSRIKLSGQGGEGRDLFVIVRVGPHPVFTRRGADLEREVPITLRESLLGGQVPVGTMKGRVLLTIPRETPSGKVFRLTGQGMPRHRAAGSGDLMARVRVVLPTNLSAEARAAGERFLDLVDQPDPRTH